MGHSRRQSAAQRSMSTTPHGSSSLARRASAKPADCPRYGPAGPESDIASTTKSLPPLTGQNDAGPTGATQAVAQPDDDSTLVLFTPAQAAAMLQVRESWLRRRAARHLVPSTFLGKHLRFSRANLDQIVADATRAAAPVQRPTPGSGNSPRRRGRPRGSRRPSPEKRTHSSSA